MSQIKSLVGYEVLDSRGNPTVAAKLTLASGSIGYALVPSGASTGTYEALELRDKDIKRFNGKGVLQAVTHINTLLAKKLLQFCGDRQDEFDNLLLEIDGTDNKSNLGANAMLAVSLAFAKAKAAENNIPLYAYFGNDKTLPVPLMNIINGGAHANNNLDIQEFMIVPIGAPNFAEALRYGVEVFHTLQRLLKKRGFSTAVGDEGGFAPNLPSHSAAIELIIEAIELAGYRPGDQIALALDIASTEFSQGGKYLLRSENKVLDSSELVAYLAQWVTQYPIISIEDGMAESDWQGWQLLTQTLGHKVQLVGDDIFVTNTQLLKRGIAQKIANAILIKPNQIGTLSETLAAIDMALLAGYQTIISHRSGETEDTMIADLAVGKGAGQIKTGSLCRSERVAKYNRLLQIEADLGKAITYLGRSAFKAFG